jgi:hypothetical protein
MTSHSHHSISFSNDLIIVVNTCDEYQDALKLFFHGISRYWQDCPFHIVVNTETFSSNHYPATIHNFYSYELDDWGERLRATLLSLSAEYILMLYDDFVLSSPVNNKRVTNALDLLANNISASAIYLIDLGLSCEELTQNNEFSALRKRTGFCINSAPGIWRRQALLQNTRPGDNPWEWEVIGSYRSWRRDSTFYCLSPGKEDIFPYNHSRGGVIYRGKWVKASVASFIDEPSLGIEWDKRGFASEMNLEKRTLYWRLRFVRTGIKMVGWRVIYFLFSYLRVKICGR